MNSGWVDPGPGSPAATCSDEQGFIAAQTTTLQLSTATTLITANGPVKIAEDYALLPWSGAGWI